MIRIYDQVRARPLYIVDRTVNLNEETASFPIQSEVAAAAKGVLLDDRGRAA